MGNPVVVNPGVEVLVVDVGVRVDVCGAVVAASSSSSPVVLNPTVGGVLNIPVLIVAVRQHLGSAT